MLIHLFVKARDDTQLALGHIFATQGVYSLTFVSDLHHSYCVNPMNKQFVRIRVSQSKAFHKSKLKTRYPMSAGPTHKFI